MAVHFTQPITPVYYFPENWISVCRHLSESILKWLIQCSFLLYTRVDSLLAMQNLLLSSNDSRRKFQPFLNKKCLTYVLLLSVGILIVLNLSFSDRYEQGENAKRCFFHNGKNPNASSKFISYFDDLMTSVKQPEMDTSIFFLQTHCTENAIVSMRPR